MKIALQPSGSEELLWLAGDPEINEREFSSVKKLIVDGRVLSDEQTFVRGSVARIQDRANLITTLSWEVTRLFVSSHEAELWLLDYDSTQPRFGTLVIESEVAEGGTRRRYLHDALVSSPKRHINGLTVHLSYTVRGGAISSTPPSN